MSGARGVRGARGARVARRRDARAYTRLPLRINLALLPVAMVGAGAVAGWRGAVGAAVGVGVVVLVFAGGGLAAAFAGRGTGGRLLAVTLAGLLLRLMVATTVLWLLAETGAADGHSVAVTAMLAVIGTHAGYVWAAERDRRTTTCSS